jgi:hypothetical protein
MLRMTASDPNYPAWNWLLTMRAAWVNAGCHWDLCDVAEAERKAMVAELTDAVEQAWKELSA